MVEEMGSICWLLWRMYQSVEHLFRWKFVCSTLYLIKFRSSTKSGSNLKQVTFLFYSFNTFSDLFNKDGDLKEKLRELHDYVILPV